MKKSYNLYHNLGYWFLLFIVLVFAGFYHTYFSVLFQPVKPVIHFHFVLMAIWIAMLIVQPFLIKYKKPALHRLIGRISYVVVPLLLFTTFILIRNEYYDSISDLEKRIVPGQSPLSTAEILKQAAAQQGLALFYFIWFLVFYLLAIKNKKKSSVHARYMLATSLSLLGPTVDRMIFFVFKMDKLPGSLPIELVAFCMADAVLAVLLLKDYRENRPVKILLTALFIYIIGQALYFSLPGTQIWQTFIELIMKPAP
jgi:hypothetical protein